MLSTPFNACINCLVDIKINLVFCGSDYPRCNQAETDSGEYIHDIVSTSY